MSKTIVVKQVGSQIRRTNAQNTRAGRHTFCTRHGAQGFSHGRNHRRKRLRPLFELRNRTPRWKQRGVFLFSTRTESRRSRRASLARPAGWRFCCVAHQSR